MRPAIYMKKGTRHIISFAPPKIGITSDECGTYLARWGVNKEPIEGSMAEAVREQACAMVQSGREEADGRLFDLFMAHAEGILSEIKASINKAPYVLVWPTGKYDFFENMDSIDDEAVDKEGALVYSATDFDLDKAGMETLVSQFTWAMIESL
jgi:hypothetical protein